MEISCIFCYQLHRLSDWELVGVFCYQLHRLSDWEFVGVFCYQLHRLSDWEFVGVYFLLACRNVTTNVMAIINQSSAELLSFVARWPFVYSCFP